MSEIHIRRYQNKDWDAVLQLMVETMVFHMSIQKPVFFHTYNIKMLADYTRSLTAKHRTGHGLFLVAVDSTDTPVGFVFGEIDKKERDYAKNAVKSGCVEEIYVAEKARNQKIASRLFDEMEAWLLKQGCTLVRLTSVHLDNKAARAMYEKRGYIVRVMEYAKEWKQDPVAA